MIWILVAAFACAALVSLGVLASAPRHARWSADSDLAGPQKMHLKAVPRVGGVAVVVGLCGAALVTIWVDAGSFVSMVVLLVCMLPAFLAGLWADFTDRVTPRHRLLAAALSAMLACWALDANIVRTGWDAFDRFVAASGLMSLGVAGAVFAVTGVANSINIIDGMNGLASMSVVLIAAGLAFIAWRVGDARVCGMAVATVGASLGFFVWNYPRGLVFLGDGGAYVLGFVVAELCILLTARNPQVSMLAPLVLLAYPVFETLFSMYRRRVIQRRPMTQPDGIHLHTLIYRRLMRGTIDARGVAAPTRGNSRTSPYLWLLSLLSIVPATVWWNNAPALALALLVFVLVYLYIYWRIVTFRTPAWMGPRKARARQRAALTKP